MTNFRLSALQYIFLICNALLILPTDTQCQKVSRTLPKMGSPFTITIDAADTTHIDTVFQKAFAYVDELNTVFSSYITNSETSKLNSTKSKVWTNISAQMQELLLISQTACHQSNGAFDITLGRVIDIWKKSKISATPQPDSISYFMKYCGCATYKIDTVSHALYKNNDYIKFDFGGIAKGYIAEKISNMLILLGQPRHLIDAGGDLVAGDAPSGSNGWTIAVEQPMKTKRGSTILLVANQAVATSGGTYQNFDYKGNKVSHIINPKNGVGVAADQNVTIIAKSGTDADWLATACSVMGYALSKKMINKIEGCSMLWSSHSTMKKAGAKVRFVK